MAVEESIEVSGRGIRVHHAGAENSNSPAIIVIHEVWGLNPNIRGIADRIAAQGYEVFAPDILEGTGVVEQFTAEFLGRLDDPRSRYEAQTELRTITAPLYQSEYATTALEALRRAIDLATETAPQRPIGVVGFCFGGTYALTLAAADPRVRAVVPFYGRNDLTVEQLADITAPVLAFYGEEDASLVDKLPGDLSRIEAAGVDWEHVVYPEAGHAFFNDANPHAHRPSAAQDAWHRTLRFLDEHLGGPARASALIRRRYGRSDPREFSRSSPTLELQLRHRSVREFLDRRVTDEELDLIVTAAQSASQSSNLQVWSVIAVRDAARKRRISVSIGGRPYVETADVFLAWVADFNRAARVVESQGAELETIGYLENTLVSFVDAGIAAQNALLAAESLGLGGVFVGSLRNNPAAIVEELALPEYVFPVFGLAIGHPDPEERASTKPRLPRDAVLHHEQYEPRAWERPAEAYEESVREYFADHGREGYSWREILTRRISTVEGLHGRHTMRDALARQGYDSN